MTDDEQGEYEDVILRLNARIEWLEATVKEILTVQREGDRDIRAAIDAGRRPAPITIEGDGARCLVTGLYALGDAWVTAREYAQITGIDG
jgi:hypothetical protein